jgi:hypothetical protein
MYKDILNWWLRITESESIAMVITANDKYPGLYSSLDFEGRIKLLYNLFSKYIK